MLGFYNPSVILTYLSLVSATFGISFVLSGEKNGFFAALICLMVSGVCDMFDGAVANLCQRNKEEKLFGVQIDALCDLVAFGALPAMMVLRLGACSTFSKVAAALLLLASVIRLGFFNVQEMTRSETEKRTYYLGLPVTLVSIFLPALLLLNLIFKIPNGIWAPLCLCALAGLEVSRIPLKKPYGKGKLYLLVVGVAVGVAVIFFGKAIGA